MVPSFSNFLMAALSIFGEVMLIRTLPWPSSWLSRKPLSCPVCLSSWLSIMGLAWNAWYFEGIDVTMLAFWGGAAGLAILFEALVSWLKPWPPPAT